MNGDQAVWDLFFMSIVGWQYHPGNKMPLTIQEAAEIANRMMEVRRKAGPWHGQEQQ